MASVKAIIAKLLNCDYVIEEGTSGDWTYRKWKSGIAECWAGYSIGSFAPTSSFGGTYYRILDKAFPTGFFNETPKFAEVDTYWDTGNSWGSARALSKDTIQYSVFKNSNSSASAKMRIYAIGTWKSIGGGYFLAAFSAIGRWWSHVDCKEVARQNHDVVRCAIQINLNIIAKYINSGKRHLYEYGGRCFGRDTKWLQNGRSFAKSKWREYMLLLSVWQDGRNNCGNTDKEHLVSRYDKANVRDSVSEGCLTLTRGCFAC